MKQGTRLYVRCVAFVMVTAITITGCGMLGGTPAPDSQASNANPADLTALQVIVKRLREGAPTHELQQDESVGIQANDRITVEKEGRALLRFEDRLRVELMRDTELTVSEVRLEPEGFIFARLKQTHGSTLTELKSVAEARVRLDTDYATIRAIDSDTEFLTCHAEALTCMVTTQGTAEVEAQGEVVTVEAGQSTYIFPGQPPSPPICTNPDEVVRWIRAKRGDEEVEPLGALVRRWDEEGCEPAGVEVTSTVVSLPSGDGMVSIEAGTYVVGVAQPDEFHVASLEMELDGVWIDAYEVTNAQYAEFVAQTDSPPPAHWTAGAVPAGREDHPVRGVTWNDARAYCTWSNKRLPTEAEWEVAARGGGAEPPLYPWGNEPTADGQATELPRTDTYAVGTMSFNQSPLGVYDVVGNVWEWVGEPYAPVPDGAKVLRGGRHGLLKDAAYRQPAVTDDERFVPFAGFRCAANRVAGESE